MNCSEAVFTQAREEGRPRSIFLIIGLSLLVFPKLALGLHALIGFRFDPRPFFGDFLFGLAMVVIAIKLVSLFGQLSKTLDEVNKIVEEDVHRDMMPNVKAITKNVKTISDDAASATHRPWRLTRAVQPDVSVTHIAPKAGAA